MSRADPRRRAHRRVALICGAVAVFMTGAAFAAVPLYKAFCQATGFGGSIPKAKVAPTETLNRKLDVHFDTNVRDVPWTFKAEQHSQTVRIGASSIAFFKVKNTSEKPITARAAYNVSPESAGWYVRKLQCFCFNAQTLQPGQEAEFPVVYFIDPKFATDPETRDYNGITLSYTFVQIAPEPPKTAPLKTDSPKRVQPLGAPAQAGL